MCVCVSVYCLRAGMDDAILLHLWTSGAWIRTQAQRRRLIGQWQHGPAHCTFLQTAGAVWHLAELRKEGTHVRTGNTGKRSGLHEYSGPAQSYEYVYTHPIAREISSRWVLCSGCPFSAGFILYCWTSWATWFSWFGNRQHILNCWEKDTPPCFVSDKSLCLSDQITTTVTVVCIYRLLHTLKRCHNKLHRDITCSMNIHLGMFLKAYSNDLVVCFHKFKAAENDILAFLNFLVRSCSKYIGSNSSHNATT